NAEFLRGLDEVAGGDDGKERACELGIHFETAWFERRRFGSSALEVNFARRARIVRATRCSSSKRSKTRIEFIDSRCRVSRFSSVIRAHSLWIYRDASFYVHAL